MKITLVGGHSMWIAIRFKEYAIKERDGSIFITNIGGYTKPAIKL